MNYVLAAGLIVVAFELGVVSGRTGERTHVSSLCEDTRAMLIQERLHSEALFELYEQERLKHESALESNHR